jgi:hypothetical protein
MRRNNLADLVDEVDRIEAISANVFDALPRCTGRLERLGVLKVQRLGEPFATSVSA